MPESDFVRDSQRQLDHKISAGFAGYLGISRPHYEFAFQPVIERALRWGSPHPVAGFFLVEPRIPFRDQARLLGVDVHPPLAYTPRHHPRRRPYGVWVMVIADRGGASIGDRIDQLGGILRPATPVEGINCDLKFPYDQIAVATLGEECLRVPRLTGDYERRSHAIIIHRQLGRLEVSQYHLQDINSLVGILAVYR